MKKEKIKIDNIPSIIWGEKSKKIFIAIHGNMSNKEDTVIEILAQIAINKGYQVLSFDLPEHGERKENTQYLCKVQNCIKDLRKIINYVKENNYEEINLFACSMGAYFSLLEYKDELINKVIFLSPIVNMNILIENMMKWSNTSIQKLEKEKEIKTDFGQILYWDYYCYVKDNPITKWNKQTYILYGNKDNMQQENIIKNFAKEYKCELNILENGEHFFHTKEQLEYYANWISKIII